MQRTVNINGRLVGKGHPAYVIAEVGINHQGRVDLALEMVEAAWKAGADAVKIQTFITKDFLSPLHPGYQYDIDAEIPHEQEQRIWNFAREKGITLFSTPEEAKSLAFIARQNPPCVKSAAMDFDCKEHIQSLAALKIPFILSSGMSTLEETLRTMRWVEEAGNDSPILLHCVSCYPAPVSACNLLAITTLMQVFDCPVGYSDHTIGTHMAFAAVVMGAQVIEKHFTLDHKLAGPDQACSMDPAELRRLVSDIRDFEAGRGDGRKTPAPEEAEPRKFKRRGIYAMKDLPAGCVVDRASVAFLAPSQPGGTQADWPRIEGSRLVRAVSSGSPLTLEDIGAEQEPLLLKRPLRRAAEPFLPKTRMTARSRWLSRLFPHALPELVPGCRVFIFFGHNLDEIDHAFLEKMGKEPCFFMPLDLPGLAMMRAVGAPCLMPDAILTDEQRAAAKALGKEWRHGWYSMAKRAYTIDGVLWPLLDHQAMRLGWYDIALGDQLVNALCAKGASDIIMPGRSWCRPALFTEPTDILFVYLASQYPKLCRTVPLRSAVPKAGSGAVAPVRQTAVRPERLEGKTLFCLNFYEATRFGKIIKAAASRMPGRVAAVLFFAYAHDVAVLEEEWGIPCVAFPLIQKACCKEEFGRAWEVACQAADGDLQNVFGCLGEHFRFYHEQRWPVLVSTLRDWKTLLASCRPANVIISDLEDAESQIPARAANQLGIPSLSVHHGMGHTCYVDGFNQATALCMATRTEYEVFRRSGIAESALALTRGIFIEHEYPVEAASAQGAGCGLRLLLLLRPAAFPGYIDREISTSSQQAALAELFQVPACLAGKVAVTLKAHPGFPEKELLSSAGICVERAMLPLASNLYDALQQADLVIMVNAVGSTVLHASLLGKPIIFYINDPVYLSFPEFVAQAAVYFEAGEVVAEGAAFWEIVGNCIADENTLAELARKSANFGRAIMPGPNVPDLSMRAGQMCSQ